MLPVQASGSVGCQVMERSGGRLQENISFTTATQCCYGFPCKLLEAETATHRHSELPTLNKDAIS